MNDDDLELASAYLDGAVSDEERARVDASSELQELVDELRAVRDVVAEVEPPAAAARERAIAAALAVFDGASAPELTAPPRPDELSARRAKRWRWTHGLGVAAAALVVVAAGITLVRDRADAPTSAPRSASISVAGDATLGRSDGGAAAPPTDGLLAATAEAQESEAEPNPAAPNAAPMAPSAALPAPTGPAGNSASDAAAATPADTLPEVASVDDFVELAARLAAEPDASAPPDGREVADDCRRGMHPDADAVFVDARGRRHEIVVVDDGEPAGLDVATCEIVVRAP